MKTVIFILLITFAYVTPCDAGEKHNLEVARNMMQAINDRNLEVLAQYISPDVVRHSAATPNINVTSLDEFRDFLKTDFAVCPDSVQVIDVIFGSDEFVAMRATYTGTQTGPMGPFPASGKTMVLPYVGILRFTDGMITEMWVEWDNLGALTQLGHFPPPAE
jgi:steroid delta-isomerase-like uncharacterized protein